MVTNVGVYSEGADFPWVSCGVLARPSKSYARYIQMAGRILRPYHGKENSILIDHSGLVQRHGFLDEEVYWTLEGKEKAWRKNRRKKEKKIFDCEECSAQFTGNKCPQCGWIMPDWGKKIEAVEYELEEIGKVKKPKATMEEKAKFYGMLEYHRREKGYSPGWSAQKFRTRFSVWPNRFKGVGPIIPNDKFYNWIKYQNIKWAKSKENPKNQGDQVENANL